jgi:adenosylcobinamide kinase/adenosylcobinamide-phosphate guanylyltransferase
MKTFILGGVRSGKSRLAERFATDSNLPVHYLATATAHDEEMLKRIESHREHRPDHWQVTEVPLHLASTMENQAADGHCLLVDCLTLWLTNLLMTDDEVLFRNERAALLQVLPRIPGEIIMVSNETNMGIIPMGALSRRFCDEAGRLHQDLAHICDQVILTIAGLPHIIKENK